MNRVAELCGDVVGGLALVLSVPLAILVVGVPVALVVRLILTVLDRW